MMKVKIGNRVVGDGELPLILPDVGINHEGDIEKAQGGNKAAGTRVRKQMQEIKKAAQTVRSTILELRSGS